MKFTTTKRTIEEEAVIGNVSVKYEQNSDNHVLTIREQTNRAFEDEFYYFITHAGNNKLSEFNMKKLAEFLVNLHKMDEATQEKVLSAKFE